MEGFSEKKEAMEVGTLKFAWKIKNFTNLKAKIIYSDVFSLGPYKWKIRAYPKGFRGDNYLPIYLEVANSETLPSGWSLKAKFFFTVVNQIDNKSSKTQSCVAPAEFNAERRALCYGPCPCISLKELHDPEKGYLVEDTCIIKADVTMYGDDYLESHVASKESTKEDDLANNATEEDIDAFFGDLNSVIFPQKKVSSEEEAKQALAMIEEALNMAPADLNNPGRMSQLRDAFDVLSLLDDCSVLTSEQKAELISMKENIIVLPERSANAVKDIELFDQKELVVTTLNRKLVRCLVEFEKAKAEALQNEQNIVTLQEQVDSLLDQIGETKSKKENSSSKQKEMFKRAKEMKVELDVLVKSLPEYEAKKKAAEEEEKVVGTEWSKMKQTVSSLKKPFYSSLKPQCTLAKKSVKREKSTCSPCTPSL